MIKRSLILVAQNLKVDSLLSALECCPDLWKEITARQTTEGSPHYDTETIFLRWSSDQSVAAAFTDINAVDYPAMKELPEAKALIEICLSKIGYVGELGRAMIVRLKPDGSIPAHIDEGLYADHFERFHLCLQSSLGNSFYVRPYHGRIRETVSMLPGELWYFNHKEEHSVVNASSEDRIHLILDCVAPAYKRER